METAILSGILLLVWYYGLNIKFQIQRNSESLASILSSELESLRSIEGQLDSLYGQIKEVGKSVEVGWNNDDRKEMDSFLRGAGKAAKNIDALEELYGIKMDLAEVLSQVQGIEQIVTDLAFAKGVYQRPEGSEYL